MYNLSWIFIAIDVCLQKQRAGAQYSFYNFELIPDKCKRKEERKCSNCTQLT
jgi:hypothetical protein